MSTTAAFRTAMDAIRTVADPDPPWAALLDAARTLVGADAAGLMIFSTGYELTVLRQQGLDDSAEQDYRNHFAQDDPIVRAAQHSAKCTWLNSDRLRVAPDVSRHPFYNEYLPTHRIGQVLACELTVNREIRAGITFLRATSPAAPRDDDANSPVGRFVRALSKAIDDRARALQARMDALDTGLAAVGDAMLLITPRASILMRTANATEWLVEGRLLGPTERTLTHPHPALAAGLRRAIARADSSRQAVTFSVPTSWGEGLRLDIAPAPPAFTFANESTLIVRMRKNSAFAVPGLDELAAFFSLTPAEARVLASLVSGHSPAEYATATGVATATVRNQIGSLMRKMSCSRQSELVRLGTLLF
ncbi:helix-turn-helix transcriptional regulator [Burkholderia pseudomultivorans]|uniref:helix-turn-helix transcriptional regulator n=1 Tax=Burkholderia pseudomultivorans TaxID=1207504 RepID=UPI0009BEF57E|nr:helix-turn-helix transcriptional regulator [Burkholderia pseudomultivorans]